MADDALAFLVEAFGHYSEADLRAFLAESDRSAVTPEPFATGRPGPAERVGFDAPSPLRGERAPSQAAWA